MLISDPFGAPEDTRFLGEVCNLQIPFGLMDLPEFFGCFSTKNVEFGYREWGLLVCVWDKTLLFVTLSGNLG